jgi:hypothetical protein
VPRIRGFKPEIHTDSKTGMLSDRAFRVFLGLMTLADRHGVVEYDVAQIKVLTLPYCSEPPEKAIGKALDNELFPCGLVVATELEGRRYLWIKNFSRHQKIDTRYERELVPDFQNKIKGHAVTTPLQRCDHAGDRDRDRDKEVEEKNKNKAATAKPSQPFLFWDKYPKRNGRKNGRDEAWTEWVKLSPEDQAKALESLEAQKTHYEQCQAEGVFAAEFPDPFRWLKRKRWRDEVKSLPTMADKLRNLHQGTPNDHR